MQTFGRAELGDLRRTDRLVQLAAALASTAENSLPTSLRGEAETVGAYRLLNNAALTPEAIPMLHFIATRREAATRKQVGCGPLPWSGETEKQKPGTVLTLSGKRFIPIEQSSGITPEDTGSRQHRISSSCRRLRHPSPRTHQRHQRCFRQMLLAPTREIVKFAWLAWWVNSVPNVEERLCNLVADLDQALSAYRGEFTAHAQRSLAYTHQMLGKIAQDLLDYTATAAHFSEMID